MITHSQNLSSTGIILHNDPFLVEGYKIVISNRSGYGGYYHDELDWSFDCLGTDYDSLINNIAKKYFEQIQDNCGKFNDFEIGHYDIYTARFIITGDEFFVDEEFEDECVSIEKTILQIKYDIEHCPVYLELVYNSK